MAGRTLLAADPAQPDEDVSAVEDLMREHGVLRRILLVYEECLRRIETKTKDADVLSAGTFLLAVPAWCKSSSKSIMNNWKRSSFSRSSRNTANSCRWSRC